MITGDAMSRLLSCMCAHKNLQLKRLGFELNPGLKLERIQVQVEQV